METEQIVDSKTAIERIKDVGLGDELELVLQDYKNFLNQRTMVVLTWNRNTGKHDKFFISPALQQHCEDEIHFVIGMKLGEL